MGRLAIAVLVVSASSGLAAQEGDRTLARISLALERPHPVVPGADSGEALRTTNRPKLGPFEFAAPQFRGEFIRLSLPVGEYVSRGIRTLATANRRRQEQAARRRVAADLEAWKAGARKP
jgi:hypothetical protein